MGKHSSPILVFPSCQDQITSFTDVIVEVELCNAGKSFPETTGGVPGGNSEPCLLFLLALLLPLLRSLPCNGGISCTAPCLRIWSGLPILTAQNSITPLINYDTLLLLCRALIYSNSSIQNCFDGCYMIHYISFLIIMVISKEFLICYFLCLSF